MKMKITIFFVLTATLRFWMFLVDVLTVVIFPVGRRAVPTHLGGSLIPRTVDQQLPTHDMISTGSGPDV